MGGRALPLAPGAPGFKGSLNNSASNSNSSYNGNVSPPNSKSTLPATSNYGRPTSSTMNYNNTNNPNPNSPNNINTLATALGGHYTSYHSTGSVDANNNNNNNNNSNNNYPPPSEPRGMTHQGYHSNGNAARISQMGVPSGGDNNRQSAYLELPQPPPTDANDAGYVTFFFLLRIIIQDIYLCYWLLI